ncbi:MAG: sulfurtransferase TusA family protein [Planctomycetaceae bacterium]|nr:sulfurtransferase TusA family protein [Planctomycetaceae bacterium]
MSASTIVDARGLSCPEPVLLTQQALGRDLATFTVLVSSPTARDNVDRLLQSVGRRFSLEADSEDWRFLVEAP